MLKVGGNERPRETAEETAMTDYIDVTGTPYYLEFEASSGAVRKRLGELADRVELLRRNGTLSPATLQAYYGEKRFEQIAESNALEGSDGGRNGAGGRSGSRVYGTRPGLRPRCASAGKST